MAKKFKALISAMLMILICISAFSAILGNASASVSCSLSHSPSSVYIDQITIFSFSVSNTGTSGMDIWNLWVYFDWQSQGYGYELIGSTHVTIAAGDSSPDYTVSIKIPQTTTGAHTFTADAKGQATGDWFSTSLSWDPISFTVSNVPTLQVACSANPTSGTAPLDVDFSSTVSGGLTPYSYSWDFGDGSSSSSANPTHRYTSAGTYTVTLVVTDTETNDQIKSVTTTVTVTQGSITGAGTGGDILLIIGIIVVVAIVVAALVIYLRIPDRRNQGPIPPMQLPPIQQPPVQQQPIQPYWPPQYPPKNP